MTAAAVADYTQTRLGDLIELAVENELVEFCHISKGAIVVSLNGRSFQFNFPDARTFLGSLVQGWARSGPSLVPQADASEVRRKRTPQAFSNTAAPNTVPPMPVRKRAAPSISLGNSPAETTLTTLRRNGKDQDGSDEAYVDTVLSLAARLQLVESYRKDRASHRILLKTPATTTDMSYFETLEYLTGSILDELRARVNAA